MTHPPHAPVDLTGVPVLVTGASGFIGSHVARWLAERGALVRALVRSVGAHPNLGSPGIEQIRGDFTDPAVAAAACAGVRYVFHAAATVGQDLADALHVNAEGTATLAASARAAGCRHFLHVSTVSVYDFASGASRYDEDAPLCSPAAAAGSDGAVAPPQYGVSKAEAERRLRAEGDAGLRFTVFRLGAVLGVHPTSTWGCVIPAQVRKGLVPRRSDDAPIPITHVASVIHALELSLDNPAAFGRVYNVVDTEVPWNDYLADVRAFFPDAAPLPEPGPPGGAFIGRCPGERIRRELGFAPQISYAAAQAEAAAWWRARLMDGAAPGA